MSRFSLCRQSITGGIYHGTLTRTGRSKAEPVLEIRLLDVPLGTASIKPDSLKKGTWHVEAKIPARAINEGVQTIIIRDVQTGKTLDSFALVAGTPLQDDLRADIALLRAELDLLKSAFRHHCAAQTP